MNSPHLGPGAFRLLLALFVVIEHISRFKVGVVSVMAFFVLSGYWVAQIFDRNHAHATRGVPLFYLSRALRIFPLYLVIFLMLAAVARLAGIPIDPDVWIALPILGEASHGKDIIGVTWSLDIELQFYLLLPLLIVILRWPNGGLRWTILTCALLIGWVLGVALASRYAVLSILLYMPVFLFGMAIYLFDFRVSRAQARVSVVIFLLMGVVVALLPATRELLVYARGDRLTDALFAMSWCIPLLPFIIHNVRQPSDARDRFLGNLSYAVYLVHFPLVTISVFLLGRHMVSWEKLIYLGLVLSVSVVMYHLVDRPSEAFRHRFIRDLLRRQDGRTNSVRNT
jgi:peptidoglycan/LPS O-acetylase OafA/YrhL